MKATIKKKTEVDVVSLHVRAGVRYWEDTEVNGVEDTQGDLIPCRNGDSLCPVIHIDSGKIAGWPKGTTADVHYKVCDDGSYALKDVNGVTVIDYDGYVPSCMSPSENGYGDYIIMNIDENGVIENWKFDVSDFDGSEED